MKKMKLADTFGRNAPQGYQNDTIIPVSRNLQYYIEGETFLEEEEL